MFAGWDCQLAANPASGRASAAYSVEMDAFGAMAGVAASAAYRHVIGAGEAAGGVVTGGGVMQRGGYVGQLYDVTGVTFPQNPLEVPELSETSLQLFEVWDDATVWRVPGEATQWTLLVGGEFGTLSPSGGLSAKAVYQNSAILLRAARGPWMAPLTVVVADTILDNFGSYAGDGLSDLWQVKNFGINHPQAGPQDDPDGDGSDNESEYLALTNPNDPGSVFTAVLEADGVGGLRLAFDSVIGRRYWLEASPTLEAPSWQEIAGPLNGTGGRLSFPLPLGPEPQQHFRIRMRP